MLENHRTAIWKVIFLKNFSAKEHLLIYILIWSILAAAVQFFNHCFIFEYLQSCWLFFITVYLYKCWVSRTDCSTCHYDSAAEPYLKCGWCKAVTNKCVVQEACIEEGGRWFPFTSNCDTKPNITKVFDCECQKFIIIYD